MNIPGLGEEEEPTLRPPILLLLPLPIPRDLILPTPRILLPPPLGAP